MRKLILAIIISVLISPLGFAASSQSPKKWTFIIFMNGNNNLDRYTYYNLRQMEKVGSTDDINVVVQWASLSAEKTVRLKVEKSTDPDRVTSSVIEDLGAVDMGDHQSLEDFITWSVTHYPAEHYFLTVWNHGSGWSLKQDGHDYKDISRDDISGHKITTEQLATVLDNASRFIGHKIDIYGSDACLMGMAEVGQLASTSTNYFVGSEDLEPGDGWPYESFLSHWTQRPEMTPAEISATLVDDYVDYYEHQGAFEDVTLSAFDLSKIAPLESAISDLGTGLRHLQRRDKKRLIHALKNTQKFDSPKDFDYGDVIDFMVQLKAENIKGLDQALIDNVITTAQAFVVANRTSASFARAKGVSIWMPLQYTEVVGNTRANRYRQLPFNIHTRWADTLTYVLH